MAFSEIERKRCERAMDAFLKKRRPPPHIRPQLDIAIRINGQSVEIFEIWPRWDKPTEKIESPVAKATYVKSRGVWRVFWMRQDLKWHGYEPVPEVSSLEKFAEVVHRDAYGCFFG